MLFAKNRNILRSPIFVVTSNIFNDAGCSSSYQYAKQVRSNVAYSINSKGVHTKDRFDDKLTYTQSANRRYISFLKSVQQASEILSFATSLESYICDLAEDGYILAETLGCLYLRNARSV